MKFHPGRFKLRKMMSAKLPTEKRLELTLLWDEGDAALCSSTGSCKLHQLYSVY
jgi:hypothetical protein